MSEYLRVFTVYKYRSLFPGLTKYIKTNRKPVIKGIIPEKVYEIKKHLFVDCLFKYRLLEGLYLWGYNTIPDEPPALVEQRVLHPVQNKPGDLPAGKIHHLCFNIDPIHTKLYEINYRYISQLVVIAE